VPPRHQNVELIKVPSAVDADKTEPPPGRQTGEVRMAGNRTVMYAVIAGVAIGVGVSLAAIFMFN
jgi:hypothetical protein